MIKKLSALTLSIPIYLSVALPAFASAVSPCPKSTGFGSLCNFGITDIEALVKNGVTILFIVAVVASLFFLIFGGIRWISSGGDKTRLESARNTIIASIIGLILVFSSYFILNLVLEFFGLKALGGVSSFTIPTF